MVETRKLASKFQTSKFGTTFYDEVEFPTYSLHVIHDINLLSLISL